jgi:cytidine deaminase
MEAPLNACKTLMTEYSQEKMKVVMMEIVATRNQIKKSNLAISWTENGVSSCHSRKNQIAQ